MIESGQYQILKVKKIKISGGVGAFSDGLYMFMCRGLS